MREEPKHGGPAFPVQPFSTSCYDWSDGSEGMTLRDWFAGMALQGMLGSFSTTETESIIMVNRCGGFSSFKAGVASCSYEYADAMLDARKGGQP